MGKNMISLEDLKSISYFNGASDEDFSKILRYMEKVYYKKGQIIYYENEKSEYVYFILKGSVSLFIGINDDKTYNLCSLNQGDAFGVGEMFFDNYYVNSSVKEDSIIIRINKYNFHNHFFKIDFFNKLIIQDLANIVKMSVLNNKYYLGLNKVLMALKHYIKTSQLNYGKYHLDKSITIESIANILNMTREHVSRIFSELRRIGIIEKKQHQIIVKEKELNSNLFYEDFLDKIKF